MSKKNTAKPVQELDKNGKPKKKKQTKLEREQEYEKMIHENWKANRDQGKWKFVFKFGVLSWGGFTYVLYWAIVLLLNLVLQTKTPVSLVVVVFSAIGFLVAGAVYGIILWNRNEKIFLKRYPYGRVK